MTNDKAPSWGAFGKYFEKRNVENSATHLIPYIKPNSRIIDVGCGIGTITLDLAQRVPQGSVVGIDHSEQSIATAKDLASKAGITNVEFFVGDVEDLSKFETDSFDIAHAHQVMLHLVQPKEALKGMHRIVKPQGGIVAIRDHAFFVMVGATAHMTSNMDKFWANSAARGATPTAGRINHIWMHEVGFPWDKIEFGSAGTTAGGKEELETLKDGHFAFAKMRGESESYQEELGRDFEEWAGNPESRGMSLDGWCVGRK